MARIGGLVTYASGESSARRFLKAATPGLPVIIDSGAWSVFRGAVTIDRDTHAEAVIRLQKDFPGSRFIGLDVIGDPQKSYANWVRQRELGAAVEPTLHYGVTVKDAQRYLRELHAGDWVNLGGMAHLQQPREMRGLLGWAATIMREAPDLRYHALGAITPHLLDRLPVSSADSTYWKLPLVIGRRLSLFDQETRGWVGLTCRSASAQTFKSAGRHARILRSYGVPLSEWEETSQNDEALLMLSIESHRRLGKWIEKRHSAPFDIYLAAITSADLPLLARKEAT